MADLMDDDRAQVLLVAGFVLAASFVALTLVLNAVIYTENLATRGQDARGGDAISFRNDVLEGAEPLVEAANRNGTTRSKIRTDLTRSVESLSRRSSLHQVLQGTGINATLVAVDWGTRITQNDTAGDFTNSTARTTGPVSGDWTMATGVEGTRSARLNVTDSSVLAHESDPDPLTLRVSDGSVWQLRLFRNDSSGDDTAIEVVLPSGTSQYCSGGADPTLGLTAGTFDGDRCSALEFGEDVSPAYTLSVRNGQEFQGTYSFVVNETIDSTDLEYDNYADAPGTPFLTPAVYAGTVHVEYRTPSLAYETDGRVQPGESDD